MELVNLEVNLSLNRYMLALLALLAHSNIVAVLQRRLIVG